MEESQISKNKYNFYPFTHEGCELVKDNKAVVQVHYSGASSLLGHLCGYVALKSLQVPKEWWGDYGADALQYLSIHGGITFCHVESNNKRLMDEATKEASKKLEKLREINSGFDDEYFERRKQIEWEENQKIATDKNSYVVFGFDCAHCDDEKAGELRDIKYVMELVEDMELQLLAYAKVIKEWREANKDKQVRMLEEITSWVKHKQEFGFGAMMDMLSGGEAFSKKKDD